MPSRKPTRKELPALSAAQLEILREIWDRREATVSQVWEALAARRPVARNTVLTLMDRLAKKGWLKRRSAGALHLYSAAVSRQATLGGVVQRLVDTAFAGSADSLVLSLLEGRGITADEAARIRKLIDQAKKS
jgi:predicted transcriptional regulator